MSRIEEYLGDGVYASFDGYQVWLRTPRDGIDHEIALEAPVFRALQNYVQRLEPAARSSQVTSGVSHDND